MKASKSDLVGVEKQMFKGFFNVNFTSDRRNSSCEWASKASL